MDEAVVTVTEVVTETVCCIMWIDMMYPETPATPWACYASSVCACVHWTECKVTGEFSPAFPLPKPLIPFHPHYFLPPSPFPVPAICLSCHSSCFLSCSSASGFVSCPAGPNGNRLYKNSSADEIANVNFLRRQRTCKGQRLRPLNRLRNLYVRVPASRSEPEASSRTSLQLIVYAPTPIKPSYHSVLPK